MRVRPLGHDLQTFDKLIKSIPDNPDGSQLLAPECLDMPGHRPPLFYCLTIDSAAPCTHILSCWGKIQDVQKQMKSGKEILSSLNIHVFDLDIEQFIRDNFEVVE